MTNLWQTCTLVMTNLWQACCKLKLLSGILLTKLKNYCDSSSGKSGATPYCPHSSPNLGSKHLSGTMFSSESDVKIVGKNWLNGQDVSDKSVKQVGPAFR
ncbi:hypothetical protein AVEN_132935-1 [Araneus ventricosus]|uniref:Uncharacterized protein n=1 Tax=Araneus ventricosus TaxID=182803 RepID=A0A4Y2Q3E4_ARAVE|nr:hypothetical protein AVEN_132935-1 [Araneus ventricosus]